MIARELDISVKTVESYRDRIKTKFGVGSSFELMRYAIELQITGQLAPHLKSERPHHLTFGTGFPTDGS
jgi:hypothetical protein